MNRVLANVSSTWKEDAYAVVRQLAETKPSFSSNDVWAAGLSQPHDARALGPIMLGAARKGWIHMAEGYFVESNLSQQHRRPVQVWRSQLFRPKPEPTMLFHDCVREMECVESKVNHLAVGILIGAGVVGVFAFLWAIGWPGGAS